MAIFCFIMGALFFIRAIHNLCTNNSWDAFDLELGDTPESQIIGGVLMIGLGFAFLIL